MHRTTNGRRRPFPAACLAEPGRRLLLASTCVIQLLIGIVFPMLLLMGCASANEWIPGPSRQNEEAMRTFFADWTSYVAGADPGLAASVLSAVSNWEESTFSSRDVSFADVPLVADMSLQVTASLGSIERIELSTSSADADLDPVALPLFVLACEGVVFAFTSENTAAGPDLVVATLLSDLEKDSLVRAEGKQPSSRAGFMHRVFRMRADEDSQTIDFTAVPET